MILMAHKRLREQISNCRNDCQKIVLKRVIPERWVYEMDVVRFVLTEDNDDLILSFSFSEDTEFGIEGFIIQRSPKYEYVLRAHERGPSVDWTDDDEVILVKSVKLTRNIVSIKTRFDGYSFDLSKISDDEYQAVITILEKMNFDNRFELSYEKDE